MWRNWYTLSSQKRLEQSMGVRLSPCPPIQKPPGFRRFLFLTFFIHFVPYPLKIFLVPIKYFSFEGKHLKYLIACPDYLCDFYLG